MKLFINQEQLEIEVRRLILQARRLKITELHFNYMPTDRILKLARDCNVKVTYD